jgi:hypothetical protein
MVSFNLRVGPQKILRVRSYTLVHVSPSMWSFSTDGGAYPPAIPAAISRHAIPAAKRRVPLSMCHTEDRCRRHRLLPNVQRQEFLASLLYVT